VALKFMLPEAMQNAEAAGRFLREARTAVRLKSEHVAKVLDVGTLETGAPYIVMEFLEGKDLASILEQHGRLSIGDAVEYVVHACDALAEAHALGMVHRDIKPANLFVTQRPDGAPLLKVLDFGISKANAIGDPGHAALTRTSSMLGTPLYMSPEQIKSARDVDARSDVWSLGVVLYEIFGGRVPFNADTLGGLMAQILTEPPQPLASLRPDLPAAIAAIVSRCLEKETSRRCASVGEVAQALAPFAPARSLPIVERIDGVLRLSRPSPQGEAATPSVPAARPGPPTAASWAGTLPVIELRTRTQRTTILTLGAAACLSVVVAGLAWRFAHRSPTVAGQPDSVAVSTAVPVEAAERATVPVASVAAPPVVTTAIAVAPDAGSRVAAPPPRTARPLAVSPAAPAVPAKTPPAAATTSSPRAKYGSVGVDDNY
jgi:serine/threonine-protein kinase